MLRVNSVRDGYSPRGCSLGARLPEDPEPEPAAAYAAAADVAPVAAAVALCSWLKEIALFVRCFHRSPPKLPPPPCTTTETQLSDLLTQEMLATIMDTHAHRLLPHYLPHYLGQRKHGEMSHGKDVRRSTFGIDPTPPMELPYPPLPEPRPRVES